MVRLGRRKFRRFGRRLVVALLAAAALTSGATPVGAECQGPVPSFRDVAPTAQRVLIGDVVAVQTGGLTEPDGSGHSSRFTLRVRYVPRGTAPAVMEISDLPTQPCAGVMVARVGDRIALALDGTDYTPPIPVNTIAWIRGSPPFNDPMFETITVAEVYALLGLAPPPTSTVPTIAGPATPRGDAQLPIVVAMFGLVALSIGWRRFASHSSQPTRRRLRAR